MPGILRLRSLSQTFLSQTLASTLLLSSRPLRASLACLVSIVSLSQVRTPANTSPDLLASAAFVPVQTDLKGNIAVRLLPRTSGRTGSP